MIKPTDVGQVLKDQRQDLFKDMDFHVEQRLRASILANNGIGPFEIIIGHQSIVPHFQGYSSRENIELYQRHMLNQGWVCVITDGTAGCIILKLQDAKKVNQT